MIHINSTVKTLRDMMKPVGAIADECRLNISPEGLSLKVVDPANVAMIDLNLPKEVFHEGEYNVDETLQVGLDVGSYLSLFEFEGAEDNEVAELKIEAFDEKGVQKHRLILRIAGIFEQTLTLMKPDEITRKVPKVPKFNLKAEVEVSREFLKRCFDLAAKAGDYVGMIVFTPPSGVSTFAMESSDVTRKFRAELTTGVRVTAESPVRLKSMFSLDYGCDMVKAIEPGKIVTLHLDNDHPLIMEFDVLEHGKATFMIAPRVESE